MMKQEDLFRKLGLILNELNDQYQFLAQNPAQLNELELELFQANAKFLADHVQIIKRINENAEPSLILPPTTATPIVLSETSIEEEEEVQEEAQVEEITFAAPAEEEGPVETFMPIVKTASTPEIAEIEEEVFKLDQSPSTFEFILNDHAKHETFDYEEKSVDELYDRPLSEEEENVLAQKRKLRENPPIEGVELEDDEIGPEPFLVPAKEDFPIEEEDLTLQEAPVETTTVNVVEPVEDPNYKPTLNDLLAQKTTNSINSSTGSEVKDLKQAINLNDKLLYIKDLFNGYNLAYAEAIELANKLPNFEAADNFFQKNYASKNNWAEKQATVDKFYQLLNQRFK